MLKDNIKESKFKGDGVIWTVFLFLCLISIIEVFSASSNLSFKTGNYLGPVLKHCALLAVGVVVMICTMNIKCRYFKLVTPFALFISFILLIVVFFVGESTNGSQRWIEFLGIQFQPSELAKGAVILATAQIISAMQTPTGADKRTIKYVLLVTLPIAALIMRENLSTAVLLVVVVFLMMFIGKVPGQQLGKLLGAMAALVAFVVAMVMVFGEDKEKVAQDAVGKEMVEQTAPAEENALEKVFHRFDTWKARIDNFLDDEYVAPADVDITGTDAQESHANIAIASSNVIGKGPGNSVERDFLSRAESDFIYAIIVEELGVIGAVVVCMLYIVLLFRTATIANRCAKVFPALLVMGFAMLLVVQALFNMAVAVGLVPVTGQPLPLISKGGTSSIINCVYIGIILSVSYSAKKKDDVEVAPDVDDAA